MAVELGEIAVDGRCGTELHVMAEVVAAMFTE